MEEQQQQITVNLEFILATLRTQGDLIVRQRNELNELNSRLDQHNAFLKDKDKLKELLRALEEEEKPS